MNRTIKELIKKTPFYCLFRDWLTKRRALKELALWKRNGQPVPPPHVVKQRTLKTYSDAFGLRILVETGTYYGEMVQAMRSTFDTIYSIELGKDLYDKARDRFREDEHVILICGDSAEELPKVVRQLRQPALFWLDGHFSGGVTAKGKDATPIRKELNGILVGQREQDVIVIDDARSFGKDPDYPTIEEVTRLVHLKKPGSDVVVEHDMIRIIPKRPT